jgi:hypothetical protein
MDYNNNNNYVVFNVSEIDKIDFSQVKETSSDTLRKSLDGTKTFISYLAIPSFLTSLTTKEGPYDYTAIMNILNTFEWSYLPPYGG